MNLTGFRKALKKFEKATNVSNIMSDRVWLIVDSLHGAVHR
jgi:hypothetical protein